MQNPNEVAADLLEYKEALLIHQLTVKKDRSPEEAELFKSLLLTQLAKLEPQPEFAYETNDSITVPNCGEFPESEEPESVVRKTPKVPTLAAQFNKQLNIGAVQVKREINSECPEQKLGGLHTPVKTVGKDITNTLFFFSPGGTTATYKHTVEVSVKKVSGGQFVEPASEGVTETPVVNNLSSKF